MLRAALLAAILACSHFLSLVAQQPLVPGERVRFTAPLPCGTNQLCLEPRTGFVRWVKRDTVAVMLSGSGKLSVSGVGQVAIPIASIRSIEAVRGQKPRTLMGAIIGILAGGVSGLVIGTVATSKETFSTVTWCGEFVEILFGAAGYGCFDREVSHTTYKAFWGGAAVGAAAGAAIGAFIGSSLTADRWEHLHLDRIRFSVVPDGRGRFALGASVRF